MLQIPVMTNFVTALQDFNFNSFAAELNNLVANSGQSYNGSDNDQIGITLATYATSGDVYTDSGSADNYILSPYNNGLGILFQAVGQLFVGARFRFLPTYANTGASCQVNINSLGAYSIRLSNSANPRAGDLTTTAEAVIVWDGTYFRLQNPQTTIDQGPWVPWYISNINLSPGTAPTTQYSLSAGYARDLSNTINCVMAGAITNKSVTSTWSAGNSGGSVPTAIFPLTAAGNAGKKVHIFAIWKADGSTFDSAVDTNINGTNILADATITAAGYIYARRVGSTYAPADSTIRPVASKDSKFFYCDDLNTYVTSFANSLTPALLTIPVPQDLLLVAQMTLAAFGPSPACGVVAYSAANSGITISNETSFITAYVDEVTGFRFSSETHALTNTVGQVNVEAEAAGSTNSILYVSGWEDSRTS